MFTNLKIILALNKLINNLKSYNKDDMLSIGQALKSKTVWATIGMAALNLLPNIAAMIPNTKVQSTITGILGLIAIWGRVRPVQGTVNE